MLSTLAVNPTVSAAAAVKQRHPGCFSFLHRPLCVCVDVKERSMFVVCCRHTCEMSTAAEARLQPRPLHTPHRPARRPLSPRCLNFAATVALLSSYMGF